MGLGGGFENTQDLHVMKYDEAMASNYAAKWHKSVNEEHDCMVMHKVFQMVPLEEVPDAKILA